MLPFHDCIDEHRFHQYEPERRLCAAILLQAWKDAKPHKVKKHSWDMRDARIYIASRSTEPFAFEWICQVLDINPSAVREALAKVIEKRKKKRERMKKFVLTRKPVNTEPEVYIPRFTLMLRA